MLMYLGIAMTVVVVIGGAAYLRRLRALRRRDGREVDDDVIRQIEETGRVEVEEPLDLEEAREAEERFWRESSWDEPERW